MAPVIYFVEGNIGSGKSSFLKNLQKYTASHQTFSNFNIQFIQEPVDIWKDTKDRDGKNILDHFYTDMNRFCYSFQSFAFISRIKQLDSINPNANFVFIERSVYCDKNVFASTCHDSNLMTDIEWEIYNTWFTWMAEKYSYIFKNAKYIYLQCSPETSLKRIETRAREEENNIPLEYLKTLDKKHNDWLIDSVDNCDSTVDNSTIVIDCEQNLFDPMLFQNTVNQNIFKDIVHKNIDWNILAQKASISAKQTENQHGQKLL